MGALITLRLAVTALHRPSTLETLSGLLTTRSWFSTSNRTQPERACRSKTQGIRYYVNEATVDFWVVGSYILSSFSAVISNSDSRSVLVLVSLIWSHRTGALPIGRPGPCGEYTGRLQPLRQHKVAGIGNCDRDKFNGDRRLTLATLWKVNAAEPLVGPPSVAARVGIGEGAATEGRPCFSFHIRCKSCRENFRDLHLTQCFGFSNVSISKADCVITLRLPAILYLILTHLRH